MRQNINNRIKMKRKKKQATLGGGGWQREDTIKDHEAIYTRLIYFMYIVSLILYF